MLEIDKYRLNPIYQYEARILKFLNSVVPEIQEATYAGNDIMFTAMEPFMKYPAFRYARESKNHEWHKTIECRDGAKLVRLYPIEQHYVGRIYCENAAYSMDLMTRLRFYWNEHSKVQIKVFNEDVDVSLWLLYIKIDEERSGADKKGAKRFVEFGWKSNLFIAKDYTGYYKLVKGIKFKVVAKGISLVGENDEEIVIL